MTLLFDNIDDDSLLHIFSFLSFKIRVKLESVCRRWRNVLMKSYSDMVILSLYNTSPAIVKLPDELVDAFFRRLSGHLNELNLDIPNRYISAKFLSAIVENCPNMKSLSLKRVSVPFEQFQTFLRKLSHLESLSLTNVKAAGITDRGFEELISALPNLTRLSVREQIFVTGQFISSLPETILHLSLGPNCLHVNVLRHLSDVCQRINSLNVEGCEIYLDDFKYLCERLSSLLRLNISNVYFKINPNSAADKHIPFVGLLRNLVEFHASETDINDDSLKVISLNCSFLRHLCLKSTPFVTDAGLVHLSKLRNLNIVDLSNNFNINDWSVMHLVTSNTNLKELYFCNCVNLRGSFLCSALSNCPKLDYISLCKCHNFNDNVVNRCSLHLAEDSARRRVTINCFKCQVSMANVFANDNLQWLPLSFDFTDCEDHHNCCFSFVNYDYFN